MSQETEREQAELIRRLSEANAELRAQRDALLEACETAVDALMAALEYAPPILAAACRAPDGTIAKAAAAIAAAKGGKERED